MVRRPRSSRTYLERLSLIPRTFAAPVKPKAVNSGRRHVSLKDSEDQRNEFTRNSRSFASERSSRIRLARFGPVGSRALTPL